MRIRHTKRLKKGHPKCGTQSIANKQNNKNRITCWEPYRAQFFWCSLRFVAHFVRLFFYFCTHHAGSLFVYFVRCVRMQTVVCDFFFHLKNNNNKRTKKKN